MCVLWGDLISRVAERNDRHKKFMQCVSLSLRFPAPRTDILSYFHFPCLDADCAMQEPSRKRKVMYPVGGDQVLRSTTRRKGRASLQTKWRKDCRERRPELPSRLEDRILPHLDPSNATAPHQNEMMKPAPRHHRLLRIPCLRWELPHATPRCIRRSGFSARANSRGQMSHFQPRTHTMCPNFLSAVG